MIGFIINIIICFGIPIGYLIYLIMTKRKNLKSYFCGALVFLISQIFLRIPIIQNVLPKMNWYISLTAFYPIIYCIFLGITAGIFEEVGRFLGFRFLLKKNRTWRDGIAFGIGHGGIEAILFTGISSIRNLIFLVALNQGNFDSNKFGISEDQIRRMFESITNINVLFAGIERISAITIHVGLSLMVLYGINSRRKAYLFLAVLIHGIIDSLLGILLQFGLPLYAIELWCVICAVMLLLYSIRTKNLFKGELA
jgi:uncharacterized membrane protein YhfC